MTNKEIKTLKEEREAIFKDISVEEKHSFDVRLKKPYEGDTLKRRLFMNMIRKIKDVHIVEWDDSFMMEFTHVKTWGEVSLILKYEMRRCFKATEKAYEELD